MSFEWTQDIGVGAPIEAADVLEVRQNVDSVDDKKCSSHCPLVNSIHRITHYGSHYSPHRSVHKNGVYVNEETSVHGTHNSGYYPGDDGTIYSPFYIEG